MFRSLIMSVRVPSNLLRSLTILLRQLKVLEASESSSRNGYLSGSIFFISAFLTGYLVGQTTLFLQLSQNSNRTVIVDLIDYFIFIPTAAVASALLSARIGLRLLSSAFASTTSRSSRLFEEVKNFQSMTAAETVSNGMKTPVSIV